MATFRAAFELRDEADLDRLLVAVGVCTGGREQPMPAQRPEPTGISLRTKSTPARTGGEAKGSPSGTLDLPAKEGLPSTTLPFASADAADLSEGNRDTVRRLPSRAPSRCPSPTTRAWSTRYHL